MPRDAATLEAQASMAHLEASGPYCIDDHGRMLWTSLDHAMTYANVRAIVHKSRQAVETIDHLGLRLFHVVKARAKVSEPCS